MSNKNKKPQAGTPEAIAASLGVTVNELMDLIMHLVLLVDAAGTWPSVERYGLTQGLENWQIQFTQVFPHLVPKKLGGLGEGDMIEERWGQTLLEARARFGFAHIATIHRTIASRQGAAK